MFISFLPIMQGWNNIGIIDLVSTCADPTSLLADELYLLGILNTNHVRLGGYSKTDSDSGLSENNNNNNKKAS